jgi:hypothetical protein
MMENLQLACGFASLAIILTAIPLGVLLMVALYRGEFDGEDPRIRRGWYAEADDVVAPIVTAWRWTRAAAARVAGWLW